MAPPTSASAILSRSAVVLCGRQIVHTPAGVRRTIFCHSSRRTGEINVECGCAAGHANASHMKVAQKPRGTARFRRYELVSVCGIRQWRRHSCLLSQRAFFGVSFLLCALDAPRRL